MRIESRIVHSVPPNEPGTPMPATVADFLMDRVRDATGDRWPTSPDLLAIARIAALAAGNARRVRSALDARTNGLPYVEPAERVAAEHATSELCARILAARWSDHPDYEWDWIVP